MRWLVLVLALALPLSSQAETPRPSPPPDGARKGDDRVRAREQFKNGSRHFRLGEFQEALHSFKEAYRAYEDPSILFNIAQCHRQLNQKAEAIRFYKQYLAELPKAPNRDDVRRVIAMLESALAQEGAARDVPPTGPMQPVVIPKPDEGRVVAPPIEPSTTTVVARPAPVREPVHKTWWFWTALGGGAAAVAVGVGLGVALTPGPSAPMVQAPDGVFHF